jgi:hypothetical protein
MSSSPQSRVEELQIAIAARLKKVCYDWPRDRFDEVVRNLAFITVKYEQRMLPYTGASTEELLAQMKALRQRSSDHRRPRDFTDLSPGF